mgnify:CR=1 FL=1
MKAWRCAETAGAPERVLPTYILWPYIVREGGAVLCGPPGCGKGYIALLMAVSTDAGVSTIWPVQQARVLLVNLRRSDESLRQRLGNVNAALGLPRTRRLLGAARPRAPLRSDRPHYSRGGVGAQHWPRGSGLPV